MDFFEFVKGDRIHFGFLTPFEEKFSAQKSRKNKFFREMKVRLSATTAALPDIFMRNCQNNIIELAFSYKNVDDFFPKLKFCHIHEPSKWSNNAD